MKNKLMSKAFHFCMFGFAEPLTHRENSQVTIVRIKITTTRLEESKYRSHNYVNYMKIIK